MPGRHAKPRPGGRRAATTLGLTALMSGGLAVGDAAYAAPPQLTTQASGPIALGGPGVLINTATVSGRAAPPDNQGKVTFKLYGPDNATCTGPAFSTSVANLANNSGANPPSVASDPVVPTAPGTYRWVATYTGANDTVSTACGDPTETTAVSAVPTTPVPGPGPGPNPDPDPDPGYECFGLEATMVGTDGNNTIHGTSGRDVIVARGGDDIIYGDGGDDVICAGNGDDHLRGGSGDDECRGGQRHLQRL